jgi:hypothetical protein
MGSILDKINDVYVKYHSPTEHLSGVEITVLFKGRVVIKLYAKEVQMVWDKSQQAV